MPETAPTPDRQKQPSANREPPAASAPSQRGAGPLPPALVAVPGLLGAAVPLRRHADPVEFGDRPGAAAGDRRGGAGGAPGLPGPLRAGLEELSGLDLSDVRVRYNSPEPARRHALAHTSGSEIDVAPGQERHLAHEGWHVVQQKLGRVRPSLLMKGAALNVDPALEREADMMGARAAALARTPPVPGDRQDRATQPTQDRAPLRQVPLRHVPIVSPALQLKGEAEFNRDPSAFLEANQVLVAFDEGVMEFYELSAAVLKQIADHQKVVAERELAKSSALEEQRRQDSERGVVHKKDPYDIPIAASIARAKNAVLPETIKGKGTNMLMRLMEAAMEQVSCERFVLATREVRSGWFGKRTQYIVTPALEMMSVDIDEDVTTPDADGDPVSLRAALQSLKRKQEPDGYIRAALIPYETNPNLVDGDTSVDVPVDGDIKVAFTAGMNGCSLAVKKKSDTELTVWHFPSPDSNVPQWNRFKQDNDVGATYDWREYNGLSGDELRDKNHVTTTVMIRDRDGWSIKSQQNVGPEGGNQQTDLLTVGKVFGRRLEVGEEVRAEIEGGHLDTTPK